MPVLEVIMSETVVVLGASNKEDRYSYKAMILLQEHGHKVIPVHPKLEEIEGVKVVNDLSNIKELVDTFTVYLAPERSAKIIDKIIALNPKRVITNPGTESKEIDEACAKVGIEVVKACTLVLLRTNQF